MFSLREGWRDFWSGSGGGREVLAIGYPLILSQASFTVQVFVDRLFLTWYSPEAVAGAVTGLFATWAFMGLCIGTGEYLTTFVAQYLGSGRPERVGPAIWQGIYFSLLAGLVAPALLPLMGWAFSAAGHDPALQHYETAYSRVLLLGTFPIVLMATLSSFFAGRGKTMVILIVNIVATFVDTVLSWLWIFGRGGFPEGGVLGAGLATIVAQALGAGLYLVLILRRRHRQTHRTLAGWRLEPALFVRLLRYGLPAGMQYSMEILAFAVFMLVVGRLGTAPLAATSIAFNLNMIVFMPMIGLGTAVSSLVGRHLGANRPDLAERSVGSAFALSLAYMTACGLLYVFGGELLLAPYAAGSDPAVFAEVGALAVVLLRFVALYSIFDMMNVIFSAGLRGAGDTAFPFAVTVSMGWLIMVLPAYLWCVRDGGGIYAAWTTASAYCFCAGFLMFFRFRRGGWKSMRVVEPALPGLSEVEPA
jgi:MATE family multidrug resistance protein